MKGSDNCVVKCVIKRLPMLSSNLARNISYLDYTYDIEKYLSDCKMTHVLSCSMFSKMLFSKYTEENTVDINRDVSLELIYVRKRWPIEIASNSPRVYFVYGKKELN